MSHEIVEVTDQRITLKGYLGFQEIQFVEGEMATPAIVQFLNTLGVTLDEVRAFKEGNENGSK